MKVDFLFKLIPYLVSRISYSFLIYDLYFIDLIERNLLGL